MGFTASFLVFCLLMTSVISLSHRTEQCDVIVAGGSTAALAAAIAAARDNSQLHVCLTEPTDWLGGQLTSAGVPAIDFGQLNRRDEFQPRDFADMMASLGAGNPGSCWVSTKCYLPRQLVEGWIAYTVNNLSNLRVFYNTTIKRVQRQGRVISVVEAVQRMPRPGFDQWSVLLSDTLQDWYSELDSSWFSKTLLRLEGRRSLVVVEATELGDVLVLAQALYRQGAETPAESSRHTLDTCGQAFTFPFYIQNGGNGTVHVTGGTQASFSLGQEWGHVWSYRRVRHGSGPYHASSPGDVSNQNWGEGNDFKGRYFLLPLSDTQRQRSNWQGGVNIVALRQAEERAYGWFRYYVSVAPNDVKASLSMAGPEISGTSTGLSKIPYVRDSRRSVGLQGYQQQKSDFAKTDAGDYGTRYPDTVALGDYHYADVHGMLNCPYPHYINVQDIKPFYIPFRALTNQDVDNLVVAGKTMAMSFLANAATRMHPMEWNSGLAAGLAASIMAWDRMTSQQLLGNVAVVQTRLRNHTTLDWTLPRAGGA